MTAVIYPVEAGYFVVEYDDAAVCISCGQPVGESASMAGTAICARCDVSNGTYSPNAVQRAYNEKGRLAHMYNAHRQTFFKDREAALRYLKEFYPGSLTASLEA